MSKFIYDNKFKIKSTNVHGVLRTIEDPDKFEGTEVRIDFFGAWDSNERKSIIKFNTPISNMPTSFHIISDFNSITSIGILFENREKAQAYVDELKQYASDHDMDFVFLDFLPHPCQLYHDPCKDAETVIKPKSTILFYNKNTYYDTEEDLIKKLGVKDERIILQNLHNHIMCKEEAIIWDEDIRLRIYVMPQIRIITCINDKDDSCTEYAYNIVEH